MRPTVACLAVTYEARPATACSERVEPTNTTADPLRMRGRRADVNTPGATTERWSAAVMAAASNAVALSL
eukprot:CAMPEP_0180314318 /NCGR_PEP_ID=MMETSP0988-20121125/31966_1 /TAXON_ID=697907 /ORGANISM="non described non described, Strain CCMP2293" /LENGTH=69 /DNA_ID=CAMNT_0022298951 /DNA_START=297 /DNA_END=502 /DNA_ORIENTATION=-